MIETLSPLWDRAEIRSTKVDIIQSDKKGGKYPKKKNIFIKKIWKETGDYYQDSSLKKESYSEKNIDKEDSEGEKR